AFYPLYDEWGAAALWALTVGGSILLSLVPLTKRPPVPPKAVIDPPNCNGCTRCFADCPFGAVTMASRTDGSRFSKIAVVDPSLCTGCGICFGACPTGSPYRSDEAPEAGIYLPDLPLTVLRERLTGAVSGLDQSPRVLVVGCERGADLAALKSGGIAVLTLPCVGMISPSFIDFAFNRGRIDGLVLTGCREGDCFHRLGILWTEQRITGERPPELRARVPRERMLLSWIGSPGGENLLDDVVDFRDRLKVLPPLSRRGDAR
ncbi:MAG: hydrogenase iron-sulfur subunit, partial [Alphaproteobacteria bacterium]|nr:hydrogenase iron-sulfur subunit [Alphaproteobacteria bacterium]